MTEANQNQQQSPTPEGPGGGVGGESAWTRLALNEFKDDFKEFRKELRDDMKELKSSVDAVERRIDVTVAWLKGGAAVGAILLAFMIGVASWLVNINIKDFREKLDNVSAALQVVETASDDTLEQGKPKK